MGVAAWRSGAGAALGALYALCAPNGLGLLAPGVALAQAQTQKWDPPPVTADRVLERYETKVELSIFVGAEPSWCTAVFEGEEVCTWTISNRQSGWRALAATVPTKAQVFLVCELPTSALGREPGSCSVHPRRSNRADWKPPFKNDRMERTRRKRVENEEAQAQRRRQAVALLDSARTLMDLSRLVGRGPDSCVLREGALRWRCSWRADLATEGQGTLATAAGADYDQKITLDCFLPADRSPRSLESCTLAASD
jgi:hypothetical protein